jgi:hypothetical protein
MAGVLVSYRRDDSGAFGDRLVGDLRELLGVNRVFPDTEIPQGTDFTDVLHRAIAASDALLVVIGPGWASFSDPGHGPHLFEPTDWVRTEIEAAFAQGRPVIPVLVGGAQMPAPDALPNSIARLARLQPAEPVGADWDTAVEDLADRLRRRCPALSEDDGATSEGGSPAQVLHELGERFVDELEPRRRPRLEPPMLPPTSTQRLLDGIGHAAIWLLSLALLVGLVYAGLRLFGGESVLRGLDTLEAWLDTAWRGLLDRLAAR